MENTSLKPIVLIRGAGEMATGIAYRVYASNYRVCLTEIPFPLAVSRANTFSDAVFDGSKSVCGVTAERTEASVPEIGKVWQKGNIPLIIDPDAAVVKILNPDVIIHATMVKTYTGTWINDAPLVIGVGPGFCAGRDVHIVIETNDSLGNAGKLILEGESEKNTGIPAETGGVTTERVIWAPQTGIFTSSMQIGDSVEQGQVLGMVADLPLKVTVSGKLRGIIRSGLTVPRGAKLIEIDPVNETKVFSLIRGKIWNVGGGVLEAIQLSSAQATERLEKD